MTDPRPMMAAVLVALSPLAGGQALAQGVDCRAGHDGLPCWLSAPEVALQPVPSTLRFQARVSRAKLPSGQGVFRRLVVKLKRGREVLCSEEFRDVRVRAGVINLEVGRNLGCALEEVLAESDELLFQVCVGGPDNCLRPIPLGTSPYAVKAAFAREVAAANQADVAARASYAHRLTADRELLPGREPGTGYFDFRTPPSAPALHDDDGFLEYAAGGFLQWTPVREEEPTLHVAARDHDSGLPAPLYRLRLAALRTHTTGRLDVLRGGLHVLGDSDITGATSVRGQLKVEQPRGGGPGGWLVAGDTGVTGTLTTTERALVEWNGIHVRGDSEVDGGFRVGGPLSVVPPAGGGDSGLAVARDAVVDDVLEVSDGVTVAPGRVAVAGDAAVTGGLSVAGELEVPQDMTVLGDLVVREEISGLGIDALAVVGPDGDPDGDGVPNRDDNCPFANNPEQEDPDLDGQGDVCDPDRDGDGHHNDWECWPDDPEEFPAAGDDATCDGQDDDCDHETDEGYVPVGCIAEGEPGPEVCEGGSTTCVEGIVVCHPRLAEPLAAEGVLGATEGGGDHTATACGVAGTPDVAYVYENAAARTLRFSLDHPETSFGAALEIRRECANPVSAEVCADDVSQPVVLEDAEPGTYVAVVEGAGAGRTIRSTGGDLTLPAVEGYRGQCAELQAPGQSSWRDGGNDAYDGWGQTTVTVGGVALPLADVSVGERVVQVGDTGIRVRSSCSEGLWRLILEAADPAEAVTATVAVTGGLGSDGDEAGFGDATFEARGVELPFHWSRDTGDDPDLVWVALPATLDELDLVEWQQAGDEVRVDLTDVTLPVVVYSAPSYAERAVVLDEIGDDLSLAAARTGSFRLTVEVLDRCDGADDDGDGEVDEDHLPEECDTGLHGICAAGETYCDEGQAACGVLIAPGDVEEVCEDGLDNNCDGEVDDGCQFNWARSQWIDGALVTCATGVNNDEYFECTGAEAHNRRLFTHECVDHEWSEEYGHVFGEVDWRGLCRSLGGSGQALVYGGCGGTMRNSIRWLNSRWYTDSGYGWIRNLRCYR